MQHLAYASLGHHLSEKTSLLATDAALETQIGFYMGSLLQRLPSGTHDACASQVRIPRHADACVFQSTKLLRALTGPIWQLA